MGYCEYIEQKNKFFCDWNGNYYTYYGNCKLYCGYKLNGSPVPVSKTDLTFLGAEAGILFGALFMFALFKALL